MRKTDLKTIYFSIYLTYVNSHSTLEDIGFKYNISKQRVWQIVRFCKLGEGDYYRGLKSYNKVYKSFKKEYQEANAKTLNIKMREWLKLKNIRLIKIK